MWTTALNWGGRWGRIRGTIACHILQYLTLDPQVLMLLCPLTSFSQPAAWQQRWRAWVLAIHGQRLVSSSPTMFMSSLPLGTLHHCLGLAVGCPAAHTSICLSVLNFTWKKYSISLTYCFSLAISLPWRFYCPDCHLLRGKSILSIRLGKTEGALHESAKWLGLKSVVAFYFWPRGK